MTIFDFVIILVEAGGVLSNVLLLGESTDVHFVLVLLLRLGETVHVGGLLHGQWQFTKGSVCLLRVQSLSQCSQIYTQTSKAKCISKQS